MTSILDSLVGRAIMIILAGIAAVQLSSQWIYESTLSSEAAIANQERLADRIVSIYQALAHLPDERRDQTAHDLSSGAVEAHWGVRPRVVTLLGSEWQSLQQQLLERLRLTDPGDILVGLEARPVASLHVAIVALRLPDRTWINVGVLAPHYHPPRSWVTILTTTLVALAVLTISIVLIRWLTRPLERVSAAARAFHVTSSAETVPEEGPREIRMLATAFNDMQKRIQGQLRARTHALAAVSHDLRTPLSRVRLRLEELGDDELRAALEHDIDEMERMIEATLSYLKGGRAGEGVQSVELAALVGSIVDEAMDMGQEILLSSPQSLVVKGRRLALKRALSNLLQNAIKYAGSAEVSLSRGQDAATIVIADRGPGVPEESIPMLFEPFVRLETSRNSESGGFGLGLTIASEIVQAHNGRLEIRNRAGGGIEAIVVLPIQGPARNIS